MSGIHGRFRMSRAPFELRAEFETAARGVTALFGSSGAGKTTLLRCIAGLDRASEGFFEIEGTCWQDHARGLFLPPHQRPVGFVFQQPRLFPHLSVRRNLEYGLRRTLRGDRRVAFDEAVRWMGMENLLDRDPSTLSGGEQKRAAIARAILTSPRLLLMDEPLAGLDAAAKAEILPYIERLGAELSMPVVYVTHSMDEVARIADRIILLAGGAVTGSGTVFEMASRMDLPTAHSDEAGAIIETVLAAHDEAYHLSILDFAGGRLCVSRQDAPVGSRVRVRIAARDVSLALDRHTDTSILNIFPATVVEIAPDTVSQLLLKLDAGGTMLLARITRKSAEHLKVAPGTRLFAQIKSVALLR
ncbi:molybdenum ABC transporter ATP-binding protein [Candidatus Sumerlaeota bacterium]|nr:molybdenum ABC transporter ATP-binding protein [Candidatus Sumerlaeota bacterium]